MRKEGSFLTSAVRDKIGSVYDTPELQQQG